MLSLLRPLLLGGVLASLVAGSAGAAPGAATADAAPSADASAYAIKVLLPNGTGAATPEAVAPPDAVEFGAGFSYPDDGSIVSTGSVTASASATRGAAAVSATASSEASSVSLFGGEVTVEQATSVVTAGAKAGQKAKGDLSKSAIVGLTVRGQPAPVAAGRVELGEWGYAVVLARSVAVEVTGYRGSSTGLEIRLTADHGGLPAGSQILIGYAEVSATPGPALPPTTTGTASETTATTPASTGPDTTAPKEPPRVPGATVKRATRKIPPLARRPLPSLVPKLTKAGYVFPVHGPCSFADTFGAARANVGWHHGEDLFALTGAPVLAVTEGTVFSVGWNDIGGLRLWLRDQKGNEFYYAHLSAYSPLAVNGARVQGGDVLGFVGNTGDAETTPPHLHFEIHPAGLLNLGYDGVIRPYTYLVAWRRLEDVRFVAGATWVPSIAQAVGRGSAPSPGAYLLSSSDISTSSGLEPGSLERALEEESAPVSTEAVLPQRAAGGRPGPPRTNVGLGGG